METPKIRKIVPEDLPVMLDLMKAFSVFDGTTEELQITQERLSKAYFRQVPDLNAIVALMDEEVVGFMNYTFSFSSFELKYCLWVEDVYIRETYRRKGIGEALFEAAKQLAKEHDCARLEWLVRSSNTSGINFYKKINALVDPGTFYVKWPLH